MGVAEQGRDVWRRIRAHQPIGAAMLEGTFCNRSRSRNSSFHSGVAPASHKMSSRCFCIARARKEQNTWPRMAASDEWKNWPRAHYRFRAQEQIFDLRQIAIAEHGLQRRHFRVGPQHEDSVETSLFGELSSVDLERSCVLGIADLA
jgi:hypothetical protein